MILTVPFVVVSIAAGIINLIVSFFIAATLVFYARYSRDEYANSIRWSRTGGPLEMFQLLRRSYQLVPKRSSAILVSTMVVSFFAMFIGTALTAMISRIDTVANASTARAFTTQLINMDPSFWTAHLGPESTVDEILTLVLNNTRLNPSPIPRTRYTPRSFPYEARCNESNVFITKNMTSTIYMPSMTVPCKAYIMMLQSVYFDWEPMNATIKNLDSSTLMAVTTAIPKNGDFIEPPNPSFFAKEGNKLCARIAIADEAYGLPNSFPKDGLVALPATYASNCQYGADGSLVFSTTPLTFTVNHVQDFDKITASILDDPTSFPLLKRMSDAINEGVFVSPTNNSTLVMFANISPTTSDIQFFACKSRFQNEQGNMSLICTYTLTSFITVIPQPMDPTIAADLDRGPEPPNMFNASKQLDFTIHHLPGALRPDSSQTGAPLFSTAHLIHATVNATRYLASLGHNVHVYKDQGAIADQLYILYDSVELKDGYEISTTAFVIVCTLTGIFGLLWAASEYFFPPVYNATLFKTIYMELQSKDKSVPMLMHYTQDPSCFDGHQVVPEPDDLSTIMPGAASQDQSKAMLQRRNVGPNQIQEHQPLMPMDKKRDSQGHSPPISPRPSQLAFEAPYISSAQTEHHLTTFDGASPTLAPPSRNPPTLIQSPFD